MSKVSVDLSGLEKLMKNISRQNKVKVGVLSGDNARESEDDSDIADSNASIGLVMEMGSTVRNIPPRSFIRMPLEHKTDELAATIRAVGAEIMNDRMSAESGLEKIGIAAEGIIQDAFSTSGFGQWKANKSSTVRQKGSSKPLIDTGQLRRAISSEVV